MNRTITILITEFLKERRESAGGWAEITDEDVKKLNDIIDHLITEKCAPDPDGDFPLQVLVIDKRRYRTMYFRPLPHESDFINDKEMGQPLNRVLEIAEMNLGIAFDAFKTEFSLWRHRQEEKAKRMVEMEVAEIAAKMKPGDKIEMPIYRNKKLIGKKTLILQEDDTFTEG